MFGPAPFHRQACNVLVLPQRTPSVRAGMLVAGVATVLSLSGLQAHSEESAAALASRSSIIVVGAVERAGSSDDKLLQPTSATAVIKITRMIVGREVVGDQTGKLATVILRDPDVAKGGTQAIFFGNIRFIGKTITIADEGELAVSDGAQAAATANVRAKLDAPIRSRLAVADVVFSGKVEKIVAPGETREGGAKPVDEHDPQWQIATVRVASGLRGAPGGSLVSVVFPASQDIVWFNSPKLHVGETALILGHRPRPDEAAQLHETGALDLVQRLNAVVVSQPYDVLPVSETERLKSFLQTREIQR